MKELLIPREVPHKLKYEPPVETISTLMKRNKEVNDGLLRTMEAGEKHTQEVLAAIAIQAFDLTKAIEREAQKLGELGMKDFVSQINIAKNRICRVLDTEGVEIIDLTGQVVDDSLLESVEVLGWLYHDKDEDRVSETYEPMIKRKGTVIHPGKVTCASKTAEQ